MPVPISAAKGIQWPAIPSASNATLLALQYQLEQSQWWPPEVLESHQLKQLSLLLAHTYKYVPFYRQRLEEFATQNFVLKNLGDLCSIPVITRSEVQNNFEQMVATAMPEDHLPASSSRTSGSTGKPINFVSTRITKIFARAFVLRSHLWQERDLTVKAAKILVQAKPHGDKDQPYAVEDKEQQWISAFPSGTIASFDSGRPIDEQLDWLQKRNPEWLVTYPSNLAALASAARENDIALPALRYLSTLGEMLTPHIRELCREVWGIGIADVYSCRELNTIALQCPHHDHYHVQSERLIVEVLDAGGRPCQPGEIGRVVLTDLHNYAMPFLRYELGDYAQLGEPCECGRTLPVLSRILGRTRNMLMLPSGERFWPSVILSNWAALGPISQLQVIQQSPRDIEVKVVLTGPISAAIEASLREKIRRDLRADFVVRLNYVDHIPRAKNGKFEDFICTVDS